VERDEQRDDLGELLRSGRPGAAERVVRELGPPLYRYFRRQAPFEAEDLTQDVFLKVWQGIAGYRSRGRFRGWVFRIASNVLRDRHRRAVTNPMVVSRDDPIEAIDPGPDPAGDLVATESRQKLLAEVAALPDSERDVFLLRGEAGLRFREIAEALDIPLGTALARMHRATQKLARVLEEP
jgi:RNA polymerase sigma-70 factor (ECF subfamily)